MKKLDLEEFRKNLLLWRTLRKEESLILLVNSNMKLVNCICEKYVNSNISLEELLSIGKEGLILALTNYDYTSNNMGAFSTYVSNIIDKLIKKEIDKENKIYKIVSLDKYLINQQDEESYTYYDKLPSIDKIEDIVLSKIELETIKKELDNIPLERRKIIYLRYGLSDRDFRTMKEVGDLLGKTRQAVFKNEHWALKSLRKNPKIKNLKI